MSRNIPTLSANFDRAAEQVLPKTPDSVINAIAIQMDRIEEARRRIDEEGIVVRDLKGSVIQHPAIKIEADAIKLMSDLIAKNSRKY